MKKAYFYSYSLMMAGKLFVLFLFYGLPSGLLYFSAVVGNHRLSVAEDLLVLASAVFMLIFMFKQMARLRLIEWDFKAIWQHKGLLLLAFAVAFVCCQWLLPALFTFFKVPQSLAANEQLLDAMAARTPSLVMLAITVIYGPICEELIFRAGFFEGVFLNSPKLALAVSSGLFAAAHMMSSPADWPNWLVYLTIGLTFGLVYYKTRQLSCSIALHMVWNLVAWFI